MKRVELYKDRQGRPYAPPKVKSLGTGSIALDDHAARHQDTGADEIVVTGLSGLLADDQHVLDSEVLSALSNVVCYEDSVVCYNNNVVTN